MILLIFLILLTTQNALASSCCGGGSSSSLIILGDHEAEISLGTSFRNDFGNTDGHGEAFYNDKKARDTKKSLSLQGQFLIADFHQVALKLGFSEKDIKKGDLQDKKQGFDDSTVQYTYEFMPETTYSLYRPRGFIYLKGTISHSKSIHDSKSKVYADVFGAGEDSMGAGFLFTKKYGNILYKLGHEYSKFLKEGFYKSATPMGLTYSKPKSKISVGLNDTFIFEEENSVQYFELGAFINFEQNDDLLYSLSYSNSSLLGKSLNAPLYETISLNAIFSWGI